MTQSHLFTGMSNWLQAWSQGKLRNGRLEIKTLQGHKWSLYFHLGHLIGDTGGIHPARRWRRQLSQYCPQINVDAASTPGGIGYRCRDYEALAELLKKSEILRQQMVAVVQGSIAEVLFDIIQQQEQLGDRASSELTYTYVPEAKLYSSPIIFIQPDRAWKQAQQAWASWQQAGLQDFSPNMAPVIWQREKLQQQTSALAYGSLTTLVDGNRTLRDLALKLRQEPRLLAQSLIPYVSQGLMKFVEIADIGCRLERLTTIPSQPSSSPPPPQPNAPLIAYIDDSPRDSQIMGQILAKAGYRYINLQDSVLALPMLLEHKPSLIFLDLVMPIANGYEICAQIRRTSSLKDTPVIIFTGNDGIVDRVRAKLVRSTEFLAKPIDSDKVLGVARKYLPSPNFARFGLENRHNTGFWSANE
ncbi:MAG TPA: response regulator [Cyanobacteria bacterium UBA11049]|nr:response regulator [Cyanobacteria bacterium UBA11049]